MKFMVSILLGLNLLVQGTVLPASSCFIPNVTIPLSPAAQTDTAPAADLNVMSEFLVMAATLLDIKSKMLLPAKESEDEEEEDPRAELVQQLLEYKMYKCMAYELRDRQIDAEKVWFKAPTIPPEVLHMKNRLM